MTAQPRSSTATEFHDPPREPMALVQTWLQDAITSGVRDPAHMALATANVHGQASNRIVSVIAVRDSGLVFATHANSPKGRELAETRWSSGVLYWREVARQLIVGGPTHPMSEEEADTLWAARPVAMHPISVLSHQSAPLLDEDKLRSRAQELGRKGEALPRPASYLGYLLEPAAVEFWQSDPDRVYQRLQYKRDGASWHVQRLQP